MGVLSTVVIHPSEYPLSLLAMVDLFSKGQSGSRSLRKVPSIKIPCVWKYETWVNNNSN